MNALDRLAACAACWRGSNRLHDPRTGRPDDTESTLVLGTLLDGKFIRLDYPCSYQGTAQEGSILIGYQPERGKATAHWIDSWHMSDRVMACEGAVEDDESIAVRGSYPAPPGPDWGWRIVLRPADGSGLQIVMYNVTPDGHDALAVETTFARAAPTHFRRTPWPTSSA